MHVVRREHWDKERHERRRTAADVGSAILRVLPCWEIRILGELRKLRSIKWWGRESSSAHQMPALRSKAAHLRRLHVRVE